MVIEELSNIKKFWVGSLILISAIALIALVAWFNTTSHCEFLGDQPRPDFNNMTRIGFDTGNVLANFEGYLEVTEASKAKSFLPLLAKSIEGKSEKSGDNSHGCLITADCGLVRLGIATIGVDYVINKIQVEFQDKGGAWRVCSTRLLDIHFRQEKHYSCKKLKTYPCTMDDGQTATVNLGLELELDRDLTKVTPGEYLRPASPC